MNYEKTIYNYLIYGASNRDIFVPWIRRHLTLTPTVDTWVYTYINDSHGSATELNVGRLSPNYYYYRSFLKFDLSSIPNNSTITTADLELCAQTVVGSQNYEVFYVAGDSSVANTMTWSSQPGVTTPFLDIELVGTAGWMTWNLLASGTWNYGNDLADTDNFLSVRISRTNEGTASSQFAQFRSLEYSGTSYDPRLVIEYQPYVIPIPGTVWLLGSSLLGLVGWRRFRKN